MPAEVKVVLNKAAIAHLTLSPDGDVGRHMLGLLNRMRNNAHGRCPVRTGYLQSHIAYRENGPGKWEFYDDAEYAMYVHEGTRYMTGRPFLMDAVTEEINR